MTSLSNRRFLRLLAIYFLLPSVFLLIRFSKGVFLSDVYALVIRPFWPGSAQREWIQQGVNVENQARIQLLEDDNERLRSLLSIKKASSSSRISAAVISRSPKGWWHQLEIGKGAMQGITSGAAVLGPGGLLGIIETVTPITARVRLLTAPSSQIGVWISRTKQHSMLIGNGSNRPGLTFLDKGVKVQLGDLVSTSPASTLLPPNIPIGVIKSLNLNSVPSPTAIVELIASPEAIDWVQIQNSS